MVGKSGWTDESSVLDVSTIGTVYLADPDKLSLIAKRKHIWHQSTRVLNFKMYKVIWGYTLFYGVIVTV